MPSVRANAETSSWSSSVSSISTESRFRVAIMRSPFCVNSSRPRGLAPDHPGPILSGGAAAASGDAAHKERPKDLRRPSGRETVAADTVRRRECGARASSPETSHFAPARRPEGMSMGAEQRESVR
ncbi:hypothetical protein GCM10009746_07420 [Microbacterium paludicola]